MKLYARPSRDLDNGLESAIRVDKVHKAVLPVPRFPQTLARKFKQP